MVLGSGVLQPVVLGGGAKVGFVAGFVVGFFMGPILSLLACMAVSFLNCKKAERAGGWKP